MSSMREQVLLAVVAALDGHGAKPEGTTVHRWRTRPVEQDELPAAVVYQVREATQDRATALLDRTLRVRVEARVRAVGESPDQALDPLLTWIVRAMTEDPKFGGVAADTTEQETTWDAADLDRILGAAAVDFDIQYQTTRQDPESGP